MKKPSAECRDRARRDALIVEARRQGRSLKEIAAELRKAGFKPLSASRTRQIVKDSGAPKTRAAGEDHRETALRRLDQLEQALHAKALAGDNAAVDRLLTVMDRRAKLLGVSNAPAADAGDAVKESLNRKLAAMAARTQAAKKDGGGS